MIFICNIISVVKRNFDDKINNLFKFFFGCVISPIRAALNSRNLKFAHERSSKEYYTKIKSMLLLVICHRKPL